MINFLNESVKLNYVLQSLKALEILNIFVLIEIKFNFELEQES